MDNLTPDSIWPHIVFALDVLDRLAHIRPDLLIIFGFVAVYYVLGGNWVDLLLNVVFIGFRYRPFFATFFLVSWRNLKGAAIPAIAASLISFLLLSSLNRKRPSWTGPARPYLIPCKTTHTRLFPEKHSFEYSYLVVGVPVGTSGTYNGLIAVEESRSRSFKAVLSRLFRGGWYSVSSFDYLRRGTDNQGLRGKLDTYLVSQGVRPSDFPHAYLVTAARFLGYHFNPVSFWYLYSPDKILSAIVLEVNNTFDERRPYLILRDFAAEARLLSQPARGDPSQSRIKSSWTKDFHVSPFNSRKGTYTLLASDPLGPDMKGFRGIDVTINLGSSKGHAKLVARLVSQGEAIDPESLSLMGKIKFLAAWFWVGFVTFPRIVREAAVLFFKKKLHVWYRPEPLKDSLGRHATSEEQFLESVFRSYLRHLVEQCHKPLVVKYVSSGVTSNVEETMSSPRCTGLAEDIVTLELKVLTPVFYPRYVRYAHDFEAIFTEMADNGTIWVNEPKYLPYIFLKKVSTPLQSTNAMDFFLFKAIQTLRRRPPTIPRVSKSADPPANMPLTMDIRDFRISPMDAYVLEQASRQTKVTYRSMLLRLFVADYYLMGNAMLLDSTIFGWQLAAALLSAKALSLTIENF